VASALAQAAALLNDTMQIVAGEVVHYRRGAMDVELSVYRGQTTSEDYGADGAAIVARLVDWLIAPGDLVIDGKVTKPVIGDMVVADNGDTYAVSYAAGENVWRWSNHSHAMMRVHTVQVAAIGAGDGE